ncbi:MAG: VOC family protein [Anaerolineales bacterium]
MITNLQMVTIYVSDMQRALDFYTNKLGFVNLAEFNDGETHLIWLLPEAASKDDLATQIALCVAKPGNPRIGSASGMVFTALDIGATYDELKARGVLFAKELIRHEYGKGEGDQEAQFSDPDGNVFLLHT